MPNPNIKLSDRVRVLATIDPDAYAASTVVSDYVAMADIGSLIAIVMAGTLGSSATLDAKLVQATDSSGTSVKDITSKAITQLTEAGTDSDKQAVINCRPDELDTANDFTHVALSMTVAVATSDAGAIVLGAEARFEPTADLASVYEIVS